MPLVSRLVSKRTSPLAVGAALVAVYLLALTGTLPFTLPIAYPLAMSPAN